MKSELKLQNERLTKRINPVILLILFIKIISIIFLEAI